MEMLFHSHNPTLHIPYTVPYRTISATKLYILIYRDVLTRSSTTLNKPVGNLRFVWLLMRKRTCTLSILYRYVHRRWVKIKCDDYLGCVAGSLQRNFYCLTPNISFPQRAGKKWEILQSSWEIACVIIKWSLIVNLMNFHAVYLCKKRLSRICRHCYSFI